MTRGGQPPPAQNTLPTELRPSQAGGFRAPCVTQKGRILNHARDTVAELVACARARWKIENESFNVLKSNGYHLEHNFGHGKQNLAMMFAAMNLLAFAVHTACDGLEQIWIKARTTKRARKRFFEHIRTITAYLVFPDWQTLMQTLIDSKPPPDIAAQIAM